MITADIQLTENFNRGLAALIHDAKLNARTVVTKETGELIKTLVRLSPPNKLAASLSKSEKYIRGKIRPMPDDVFEGEKSGNKSMHWLYASKPALVGVMKEDYHPDYDVLQVAKILNSRKNRGNAWERLGERGEFGQRTMRLNRTVVKKNVYRQLIKNAKDSFGKLKAAWMISTANGGPIKLTGSNLPPAWVTKNIPKARGSYVNGLTDEKFPNFTIINRARGIGQQSINSIVKSAVGIRAKAMQANALLFMKGKKNIGDYK